MTASRPVLALLALVAVVASCAAAGRFDESRSFDRDYAQRFLFQKSTSGFLVGALFAQLRPSERGRGAGSAVRGPDDVLVDDVCGCSFDRKGRLTDPTHCAAMRGVEDEGEAFMSSFTVVDPQAVARPLACFREGSRACVDDGGAMLGGVSCCRRVDKDFAGALRDPHFAMLAPAPLARRLSGLVPGRASETSPEMCGFRIDEAAGVFSLPHRFDGMVARSMLYAGRRYGTLPPVPADVLAAISSRSPASVFEIARERMSRLTFRAPDRTLDAALKAAPIPNAFRQLGAAE